MLLRPNYERNHRCKVHSKLVGLYVRCVRLVRVGAAMTYQYTGYTVQYRVEGARGGHIAIYVDS